MTEEKKEVNLIMAGLSFNKEKIAEACNDEKNKQVATTMLVISMLLATILAFFNGNSGSSGFGREGYTGLTAAIAEFSSVAIGTFLSAYMMTFIIRIYKVGITYSETLKLYGAAIVWIILGAILGLIPGFGMIGAALWLAYNISLMFGVAGYTKLKLGQAFLTIVLTTVVIFIITVLYSMLYGIIVG